MVNGVPPPPTETLKGLGQVLFPGTNVQTVDFMFHNPVRELGKVQIEVMDSLMAGLIATMGNPANINYSIFNILLERAEDPIRFFQMIVRVLMNPKSLDFPRPL